MDFIDKDINKVDKIDIRDYIGELRSRGLKTNSIRYNLASISSLFEYAIYVDIIASNPVTATRKRYLHTYKTNEKTGSRKIISVEDASKMVKSCVDIRDRAILMLLFKTGIRRKELMAIDVEDVNFRDQSIRLKPTPKRTRLLVFFDAETAYFLKRWLSIRDERADPSNRALFITRGKKRITRYAVEYIVHNAAVRIGVYDTNSDKMEDHFSPHNCRHWFTTHLMRAGMRREYIKELRGDVRKEAIDIYMHIDDEELRKSYLAHIPPLRV